MKLLCSLSQTSSTYQRRQRGATLIEVLVALVIFAFGLLAVAGLHVASLQSSQFAAQAVVGTNYARDFGEMMQLIPTKVINIAGATSTSDMFVNTSTNTYTSAKAAQCTGSSKTCTPAQFAEALRNDWALRVQNDLPLGRAEVCKDSTPLDTNSSLEWGNCDNTGAMTLVKLGWATKSASQNDAAQKSWMTADVPRIGLTVLGNSTDYVVP